MNTLYIVGSGTQKTPHSAPAQDFYIAPEFRAALSHVRLYGQPANTRILSAGYGLVSLDQVIPPYDMTLAELNPDGKLRLGCRLLENLKQVVDILHPPLRIVVLAGADEAAMVINALDHIWLCGERPPVRTPLEGLQLREQCEWMNRPHPEASCTVELPDQLTLDSRENETLRAATRAASIWWANKVMRQSPPGEPTLFANVLASQLWRDWRFCQTRSRGDWPEDIAFKVASEMWPGSHLRATIAQIGLNEFDWRQREWGGQRLKAVMKFSMKKVVVVMDDTESIIFQL